LIKSIIDGSYAGFGVPEHASGFGLVDGDEGMSRVGRSRIEVPKKPLGKSSIPSSFCHRG
jgi:hypothetical protein